MNTELIQSVMASLDDINEKLEVLSTRINRIDKGSGEVTKDVKKLRQSMELLQNTINSKMAG